MNLSLKNTTFQCQRDADKWAQSRMSNDDRAALVDQITYIRGLMQADKKHVEHLNIVRGDNPSDRDLSGRLAKAVQAIAHVGSHLSNKLDRLEHKLNEDNIVRQEFALRSRRLEFLKVLKQVEDCLNNAYDVDPAYVKTLVSSWLYLTTGTNNSAADYDNAAQCLRKVIGHWEKCDAEAEAAAEEQVAQAAPANSDEEGHF